MLSANNILSPASGRPIVTPTRTSSSAPTTSPRRHRRERRGPCSATCGRPLQAYDRRAGPGHATHCARRRSCPVGAPTARATYDHDGRACCSRTPCPTTTPRASATSTEVVKKREMGVIVERLSDNYPRRSSPVARRDQEPLLPLRLAVRPHGVDRRRQDAGHKREHPRRLRGAGRQGRDSSAAASSPTVSAEAGGAHLDRRHRRGPAAMEKEFKAQRFNPIDMMVGRAPAEHDPDAPDRRHARPRGQPPRRHDPARSRRTSVRASRRSSTSSPRRVPARARRHRAADRRLRLPDAAPRRRRPGADRARGGLRHDARCVGRERRAGHGQPRTYLETKLFGRALLNDTTLSTAPCWPATPSSATRSWLSCATTRASPGRACARC